MEAYKIYGPPGTGKTSYLMSLLEDTLKEVPCKACAFMSFTKQGSYEGATRARTRFSLDDEDLRFFRTTHSLAYRALGFSQEQIVTQKHLKSFADKVGLHLLGGYNQEYQGVGDDKYLFAEQLYRTNRKAFARIADSLDVKKLRYIVANYRKFKEQRELFDFTDLLEAYLEYGAPLSCKVAFIDEAQDLTPLQWACVKKMCSECDKIYIAGDDDQAIYTWAGADVKAFLEYPAKDKVLGKSFRLPQKIHAYAQKVVSHIKERKDKTWQSREDIGEISYTQGFVGIDLSLPTLFLARNVVTCKKICKYLEGLGIVYTYRGESSVDRLTLRAIWAFEAWKDGMLSDDKMEKYAVYFHMLDKEREWHDVVKLPKSKHLYYSLLLQKKSADIFADPHIHVSTMHASKGTECDHIVVCLDMTEQVAQSFAQNADDELRVLYVAVTRAKKKLTLSFGELQYEYPTFA